MTDYTSYWFIGHIVIVCGDNVFIIHTITSTYGGVTTNATKYPCFRVSYNTEVV